MEVPLQRYWRKHSFAGFQTGFTSFAVLFLAPWRLFWVDRAYICQDTGDNVHWTASKLVLQLSLLYFWNFGGYLMLIKVPLSSYGQKRSFAGFDIGFTSFTVLFLEHWRLFWVDLSYRYQDNDKNFHSPASKPVLRHSLFYFRTFKVILSRLEVPMPRYWQIRSSPDSKPFFRHLLFYFNNFWGYF